MDIFYQKFTFFKSFESLEGQSSSLSTETIRRMTCCLGGPYCIFVLFSFFVFFVESKDGKTFSFFSFSLASPSLSP